ncbi:DUF805 domain-containing protein [Macrococcoides caseolyticum]|uniref:DUF805 domain-containing protein n=1 Tax=Macrococcoides caseolyticum TaxID=69966 RepID=UPI001F2C85B3|nr:DUF805 domain-containing protein [Macrococcus caseolyticus]MCE4955994.1 DUF805 domain-containing protein [Macrococcus caseolyticus]
MGLKPMSFFETIKLFWTRAFDFNGRSRRKEYWVPMLIEFIVMFVIFSGLFLSLLILGLSVDATTNTNVSNDTINTLGVLTIGSGLLLIIVSLVLMIPNLSLFIRRLHDTGRTGKWAILFYGVPLVFSIINMILNQLSDPAHPNPIVLIIQLMIGAVNLGLAIWAIVWLAQDSEPGTNRWGENPKGIANLEYYHNQDKYQY